VQTEERRYDDWQFVKGQVSGVWTLAFVFIVGGLIVAAFLEYVWWPWIWSGELWRVFLEWLDETVWGGIKSLFWRGVAWLWEWVTGWFK
jgi:hypothetical protein